MQGMTNRRETSNRPASRALRSLSLLVICIDLVLLGWTVTLGLFDPGELIKVRSALFTEVVNSTDPFLSAPEGRHASFKQDSRAAVRGWLDQSAGEVTYLDAVLGLEGTATERVQAMVPIFSRNGHLTDCGDFRDLSDTLQRIGIGEGQGCCSDHTAAFMALSSLLGISAREMIHTDHVTAEFYEPASNQWVWVDPQFALMARDEQGRHLSLLELRNRYLADEPIDFEFIGNEYHELRNRDPLSQRFYDDKSDFAVYSATWGNNVFEQDAFERRLGFLPIYARQLLGFATGQFPGYRTLADAHSPLPETLRIRRRTILWSGGLLLALNGVILAGWMTGRVRRTPP